ncbi:hypothetical protein ACGFX2_17490 [Streptomyces goshikiensis]|uniref:hypothetical protein n=1 Tax=Streptomyces goshikiensis TaxID=1942 RepID=UPI0037143756
MPTKFASVAVFVAGAVLEGAEKVPGAAALGAAGFPLLEVWGLQAVRARVVAAAVVSRVIVWCVRIARYSPGLGACVVAVTGL